MLLQGISARQDGIEFFMRHPETVKTLRKIVRASGSQSSALCTCLCRRLVMHDSYLHVSAMFTRCCYKCS